MAGNMTYSPHPYDIHLIRRLAFLWQIQQVWIFYRIMQIVRSGKVSRLHDLLVIRGKTFAIAHQFETPYNKKIHWKLSRLEANLRKPRKFSTVNDLHYTVSDRQEISSTCSFIARFCMCRATDSICVKLHTVYYRDNKEVLLAMITRQNQFLKRL